MTACMHQSRALPKFLVDILTVLLLLSLAGVTSQAGTFAIGSADGSFESGLGGMVTTGDLQLVQEVGVLRPTQGSQAALLTTTPDAGAALTDADVSLLRIEHITIPASSEQLRLDYAFLSNELTPGKLNDRFTVTLVLVAPAGEETLLEVDTFAAPMYPAPWTGYGVHTGFRTLVADVSAYAGTGEAVTLELRLTDVGDGRGDSAVFLDNLQLTASSEPQACANYTYTALSPGEPLFLDASCSTDADDTIVEYRWRLGDGTARIGRFVEHAYTTDGAYQAALTVTDAAGNTSTTTFMVVVGAINHAPQMVSAPPRIAMENVLYRYDVKAEDPELAFGDVLTFALTQAPAGMAIEPATGVITWTPTADTARRHPVSVRVEDSFGLSHTQSFTVVIEAEVYIVAADDNGRLYYARSHGDGTFSNPRFVDATGERTRGVAMADFDGDGDFDFVSGHNQNPSLHLYYYEKQGARFAPPVFLGSVGDTVTPAGDWLMDMAAEDVNNDGAMDIVVNGNSANSWLFLNQAQLTFGQGTFFGSGFETDEGTWGGSECNTGFARDDTTAHSGLWSMRVFATGNDACLSIAITPANWQLFQGPTLTFAYRIPQGVPAGLLVNVMGHGWLFLGGSPTATPGPHPAVPAVNLIDDDQWHTVSIDLYHSIRQYWPEARQIAELQWWTDTKAPTGTQFWFDDFEVTRRTYVSGFQTSLLPHTGADGRGMDAADVNADGNLDFARARCCDGLVHLYTGDGTGQFTTSLIADPGSDPYGVVLADFDSDGVVDLIANEGGSGDPYFFKGNGNGTFQAGVYVASLDSNNFSTYGVYDFNNDGHSDLVVVNYAFRQVWYYPGNGDATFGARLLLGTMPGNTLGVAVPAGRVRGQPFGVATLDTDTIQEGETITFDASGSFDDGSIVSYDWTFGDGTTASGAVVSHLFSAEGIYTMVLTLTDDEGKQDRRSLPVTVKGTAPIANAGGPYIVGEAAAINGRWAVVLDGSASTDAETGIARYAWDFDAHNGLEVEATDVNPHHAYAAPGVYTVTLTVYDEVNLSHSITTTVTVEAGLSPVAILTGPALLDETAASLGQWMAQYDISGSSDDVAVAGHTIDWGDGSSSTIAAMQDRFEDHDLSTGPTWTVNGGTWKVIDGQVHQVDLSQNWKWLQDLSTAYRDFILEVDFKGVGTTNGYMGIVFRNANSSANRDTFLLYSQDGWNFWRFYDWYTDTVLKDGGSGWDPGIWYHLKLVVVGNTMKLYVTPEGGVETLQLEANDPSHPIGGIGLLAHTQSLIYDNVQVTLLHDSLRPTHVYSTAGAYQVSLTVTDHAGQSATAQLTTSVTANTPPLADPGGPYVLTEAEALAGKWILSLDATASTDDHGIQRYTIDFGDGTHYTTGFNQGALGSYFAAGTDLYGYSVSNARPGRIIATEDNTAIEVIDLATRQVIASHTLHRFGAWNITPGAGIAFKVEASKPVVVLENSSVFPSYTAFMPSLDTRPVGHEFLFRRQNNSGFFVYAIEDTVVRFFDAAGTLRAEHTLRAGAYWEPATLGEAEYHVVATGKIALQTSGVNAYTTVPASTGEAVGRQFFFATQAWWTGAFTVLAYDPTTLQVFDLDTGQSLYTHTLAPGEVWHQSGVGTRRLRLESTGDVEVWAGDTEGGTGILDLGDGISVTAGRNGTEFYLHPLRDGVAIFAPNPGTTINLDDGALVTSLPRDGFLRLTPSDFPTHAPVHHLTASQPVLIQTLGGANGFNDYGTYLGGVSARHRYTSPGTYTLTLTATDRAGQSHTASTTVAVQAGAPPLATITAPAVGDETFASDGLWTVPFDAGGSSDDFGIFSYVWNFGDGTSGTGVNPSHVYSVPGTYTVTLTVTDHAGQQSTTTFTIVVTATAPPVADAGGPYVLGEDSASFGLWRTAFDGSGSSDDVGIMTYTWDFGDGMADNFDDGIADGWTPVSGIWEVESGALRQTDTAHTRPVVLSNDETARDAMVEVDAVIVAGTGQEPILVVRALDPDNRDEFHLRGRGINDVILERHVNGNSTVVAQAALPFAVVSNVVYRLKAVLNRGTMALYVNDTLILQTGDTVFARGRIGLATYKTHVRFDNLVVTHTGEGPTPVHTYPQEGTYTARLTVTDNALQSHTASATVEVGKGAPPVAHAGGPYTVERGWQLALDGRGATDDVHIEHYQWDFGDGTTSPNPNPWHVYDVLGTYTLSLTVTDNVLQSHTAGTTVQVITGTAPVADAGGPYEGAVNGPAVFFDGAASHDDYGIAGYVWDVDATVDTDGDGNPGNDRDLVGRYVRHTYTTAGTYTATLTVSDGAGQTATDTATVSIVANLPPRVITVPWVSTDPSIPHETFHNKAITLKGVVSDADPVTYTWDYGDGTTSGPMAVPPDGHHRLEAQHTYPDVPPGTPFVATLTVTDSQGNSSSDTYPILVKSRSLNTEANVALDEGLWYAHKQQDRSTGQWRLRTEVATTASMVNAFEANAHLPTGDPGEDPYVTTVRLGLTYILNRLTAEAIAVQPAGNPDTNGNGLGIRVNEDAYPYQGGMVMDALIASGAPLRPADSGPTEVSGRRYLDLVQDMVDAYAYGQYDHDGLIRGGWRYNWNQVPDNSASQWGAIGLIPAERNFGLRIPAFVKPENLLWLEFSQDVGSGHFGYSSTAGVWGTVATTASGMVQLAMDGVPRTDARWTQAEHHLRRLWETPSGNDALLNNFYAMFALTKAMRLAQPAEISHFCAQGCMREPLEWYGDPALGLAPTLLAKQDPDGGWTQPPGLTGSQFWERNLVSAWALLMLSRSLFEVAPEANAGPNRVWGVDVPLSFDGSGSFHADPFGSIALYEWDVDGDGAFDTSSASPTTTFTYSSTAYPAATLPRDLSVTLRVTDTQGKRDTDSAIITLAVPPHPPLADAGGPYTCTVGLPCTLDGSGSLDIDATDVISQYAWELDGLGVPDFDEAFGAVASYVFPLPGTFNIGLQVKDNGILNDLNGNGVVEESERLSDQEFTTVTVVANQAPVARAGGPYSGAEGAAIALDGTASSDPNGDPLTYSWDLDGDGLFDEASGSQPTVTFVDNGNFTIALEVSDSLLSHSATAVVVSNVPPSVEAGADQTVIEDQGVSFNGSFSDPGTADTHTLVWTFGDGGSATGTLTPTYVYATPGTYTVTLTVSDDDGGVGADILTMTVEVGNQPPVAHAGGPYAGPEGIPIALNGTASSDPDGDVLTYTWDLDNDGVFGDATGATPTVTFAEQGIYTVTLQVSDGTEVRSATATVTVSNVAPSVQMAVSGTATEGSPFTVTGAFSDTGADSWSATVDYGDGSGIQPLPLQPDQTFNLNHTYANDASYTVTVTVSDDDGAVGSATLTVTVANVAPTAPAGTDQNVDEGQLVSLDATGSFDPGADVLSYQWQQLAGPAVVLDLSDPLHPSFTAPTVSAGGATLTFALTVSDGVASSSPALVNITITNINNPPHTDAGPAQTVQEDRVVTLDGTASFDADNEPLTYTWTQTSGPLVVLSDPAVAQPAFTAPLVDPAGVSLGFELTVSDGIDTASASTTVQVANVNQAPLAHAGSAQTVSEASGVTLDGTASSDADGDVLTYSWAQVSGPVVALSDAAAAQPAFTAPLVPPDGAALVFELTVSDGLLSSTAASVTITVLNINDPPACNLARAQPGTLWPPNHALVSVGIGNVSDPDNEVVTITVVAVTQDEPVNGLGDGDTSPDAILQGAEVLLRRERAGGGNGRVYAVSFQADDGFHAPCVGTVTVCVPHSKKDTCIDDGQVYDALQP